MIFAPKQLDFIQKAFHFTPRQMDVIRCVSEGLENDEICKELGIAYNTLTSHLWNICKKVGVRRKFGLLAALMQLVQRHKV